MNLMTSTCLSSWSRTSAMTDAAVLSSETQTLTFVSLTLRHKGMERQEGQN